MKMEAKHYMELKRKIEEYCGTVGINLDSLRTAYANSGLSDMRFRWDLLYAAKLSPWISANLYHYLNDNHIDTALRNILKELD